MNRGVGGMLLMTSSVLCHCGAEAVSDRMFVTDGHTNRLGREGDQNVLNTVWA